MSYNFGSVTEPMRDMLRRTADNDINVARAATIEVAKALELPLREGVMNGDVLNLDGKTIYEPVYIEPGAESSFPISFLSAANVKDFIAVTVPRTGKIHSQNVEGDYVNVSTFEVGHAMEWPLKYAASARWDVVGNVMKVMEWSFTKKKNDDGWRAILGSAYSRNLMIYDSLASAGFFSKRLVALMVTGMQRYAGGNSTSVNRGALTDLFVSPESLEDMRSWQISEVDDFTRRQIYIGSENTNRTNIFGIDIHALDELGVGQEYQLYYTNVLGGSLSTGADVELVIGLDLQRKDSFVMPWRSMPTLFEDMSLHKQRKAGVYGWAEWGFGVLDNRRVLAGSY